MGVEVHQHPFMSIDDANKVGVQVPVMTFCCANAYLLQTTGTACGNHVAAAAAYHTCIVLQV